MNSIILDEFLQKMHELYAVGVPTRILPKEAMLDIASCVLVQSDGLHSQICERKVLDGIEGRRISAVLGACIAHRVEIIALADLLAHQNDLGLKSQEISPVGSLGRFGNNPMLQEPSPIAQLQTFRPFLLNEGQFTVLAKASPNGKSGVQQGMTPATMKAISSALRRFFVITIRKQMQSNLPSGIGLGQIPTMTSPPARQAPHRDRLFQMDGHCPIRYEVINLGQKVINGPGVDQLIPIVVNIDGQRQVVRIPFGLRKRLQRSVT